MALTRTQEPGVEPVTRDDCKAALNLDADLTADDALIDVLITGAREYAEAYCHRSFISQAWRLTLDSFTDPRAACKGPFLGALRLENGPVTGVTSITYLDMNGVWQTITNPGQSNVSSTVAGEQKLTVVTDGQFGRLAPAFGYIWPITLPQIGAVQVNYTAGYGDTADKVPAGIRNWIKLRVCTLYQNREEVAVLPRGKVEALPYIDRLLDPYVVRLA